MRQVLIGAEAPGEGGGEIRAEALIQFKNFWQPRLLQLLQPRLLLLFGLRLLLLFGAEAASALGPRLLFALARGFSPERRWLFPGSRGSFCFALQPQPLFCSSELLLGEGRGGG